MHLLITHHKYVDNKVLLKFISDLLYLKGLICFEEYEDIMSMSCCSDCDVVIEKIFKEEYNVYRRGDFNI